MTNNQAFFRNTHKNLPNTVKKLKGNCKGINPVFNKCNFYFNNEQVNQIENEIDTFPNFINIVVCDDESLIRQSTIRTLKNFSISLNLNVNIIERVLV